MKKQVLSAKIAGRLRREILRGTLAPGESVKERETAGEMGVSRTPMREALRMLANEGLLELRPGRSPVVANPDLKEIRDALDVLTSLELLSVRLACENASDKQIAAIRKAERVLAENYDQLDDIERFEADMDFHFAIARGANNAMLAATHTAYLERLWRARFLSANKKRSKERVLTQHDRIVSSIEKRDVTSAQSALSDHLYAFYVNVGEHFSSTGDATKAKSPDASMAEVENV